LARIVVGRLLASLTDDKMKNQKMENGKWKMKNEK
jgi:hypothetical protein